MRRLALQLLPLLALTSCLSGSSDAPTALPTASLHPLTLPPEWTMSPSATSSLVPASSATQVRPIPSATRTALPPSITRTPTQAATPYPTHLPTLTPLATFQDPLARARQLYGTNGDCSLPCWWGFEPGVSSWRAALQFFGRFGEYASVDEAVRPDSSSGLTNTYIVNLPPPSQDLDFSVGAAFDVSGDLIQFINLEPELACGGRFTPAYLLRAFGAPQSAFATDNFLVVHFPRARILADFVLSSQSDQTSQRLCFATCNGMLLYPPTVSWSEQDVRQYSANAYRIPADNFRPIAPSQLLDRSNCLRGEPCIEPSH
jgi:hypothetical protein